MKEKTSIILSKEVLTGIDRIAGSKQSRSAFIEAVLTQYLRKRARAQVEARDLAERLLSALSEEDREILLLKEVEGLSVQEIAEIFELNVNTVKVRMFRARANMMEAYRRKLTGAVRSHSKDRRG